MVFFKNHEKDNMAYAAYRESFDANSFLISDEPQQAHSVSQ